ncbi:MAG TPA: hypothetical protein VMB77_01910 [Syntrophales bacterium]|nr:hypothetical protein [Syntrophales bacterium]
MRLRALCLLAIAAFCLSVFPARGGELEELRAILVRDIPPRPSGAMTGSAFAQSIHEAQGSLREQSILDQIMSGNLPDFLRRLSPVHFSHKSATGETITVTLFAMPDYLSIGSDQDFIRIPMGLHAATAIADRFGFILPTRKIVDAIFSQAAFALKPEPLPAGDRMRSTAYYLTHNKMIRDQRLAMGCPLGELMSGHKKDVVLTNRQAGRQGKVAIYGWHRPSGDPIQPLSTVHGSNYADYSHGIRLISTTALLNGQPCSIWTILEDPALAGVLSDEGAIRVAQQRMAQGRQPVQPTSESLFASEGTRF